MSSVAENLIEVRQRIGEATARSGRDAAEVVLVAVGKTWPAETLLEVVEAGQRVFGENRVQELVAKASCMPEGLEWHLIGPLQKNKAAKALEHASVIESLDSLALAERLERLAEDRGLERVPVLVQANVSGETSKSGYRPEELESDFERLLGLSRLAVGGLMTVPAFDPDPERVRPAFAALRDLRDRLATRFEVALPALSMGMSHDFEVAIEEGATHVRVGSSIFGYRSSQR